MRGAGRERGEEGVGPWPAGGEAQRWSSAAVDEPAGQGEQSGADGAGDGELIVGVDVAERAVQRMRLWASTAQREPGGVGEEPPGGAVLEPGAFFEVADGELDAGVVAVELVDGDDSAGRGR